MAVSICYIFLSPPLPRNPQCHLYPCGVRENPCQCQWRHKPRQRPGAPTQTAQGEKGGHLDGDLTREAKMAGLAHEMDTHLWDENQLNMHPERTMGPSST